MSFFVTYFFVGSKQLSSLIFPLVYFLPFSPLRLFCFFSDLFFPLPFLDLVLLPVAPVLPHHSFYLQALRTMYAGHHCTMPASHVGHGYFSFAIQRPRKKDVSALSLPTMILSRFTFPSALVIFFMLASLRLSPLSLCFAFGCLLFLCLD
jgi:hypothetical protein